MIISVVSYETDLVVVIIIQELRYTLLESSIGVSYRKDRRADSGELDLVCSQFCVLGGVLQTNKLVTSHNNINQANDNFRHY
jgi:hypothetical protein